MKRLWGRRMGYRWPRLVSHTDRMSDNKKTAPYYWRFGESQYLSRHLSFQCCAGSVSFFDKSHLSLGRLETSQRVMSWSVAGRSVGQPVSVPLRLAQWEDGWRWRSSSAAGPQWPRFSQPWAFEGKQWNLSICFVCIECDSAPIRGICRMTFNLTLWPIYP